MITSRNIGKFTALGRNVDHNGAKIRPEVAVSVASVYIDNIEDKGNVLRIIAKADGAKFDFNGYIGANEPISNVFKEAKEKEIPLCVRFEKKRKKGIDPTTPIEELTVDMNVARENVNKIVCGIYDFNNNKWMLTNEAQSNPDEDPDFIIHAIKNLFIDTESILGGPQPSASSAPMPTVNINKEKSDKENALISMYVFIREQELAHGFSLKNDKRQKMALSLLKLADSIQMRTFNLEAPRYSDYTHVRARFLVFKIAETLNPITEEATSDSNLWKKWLNTSLMMGTELWNWAIETTK